MSTCSDCGAANPEGQKFCGECGAALTLARSAREERKVVTVLFADLVGFTGRAEQLDPEDVRALVSPYYARLRHEIERHGGTVEKFIGDAVMAVFGAPVAHEDDPERAVRAALAICSAIRASNGEAEVELGIRVGINTGEALVALDARPREGEGMVSGDVVNTAARLEAAAPVNGILVGETTYRATQQLIDYREAAPVQAKGKAQPVLVWEAIAARARFGVDVPERPTGRLVGRARELSLLVDALEHSGSDQTAQLVTLVGVPGIGKSRLVAELFARVDEMSDLYWWRQGRSLPYGETQSFWALAEIVKAQAGILESDDAESTREKLADAVRAAVPDERGRAWVEGHLRPLVGVGGATATTADRAQEVFAAWRRFLEGLAEQGPLVLVFEDLHWADDGLLDFVDYLAEWVTTVPLLIVATARPELLERRPDWGGGKRNAVTVSIAPLAEEETAQLLAALLDQALLPADVQAEVLSRSAGNPLYTEEYVRMLQDRGFLERTDTGWRLRSDDPLPLPETVQGIVAARLDALPPEEKEALQAAAVLGKVFWPSALAFLLDVEASGLSEALHALVRKEFIRRERRSAVADDEQYAFLHVLVRDLAYGQIPRAARAEKHRAAADWIEGVAPDRTQDHAEMLAHHLHGALELAEAAGQDASSLRPRVRDALVAASERAEALYAWPAARNHARKALELTERSDDAARAELALRIAWASYFLGDNDVEAAAEAREAGLATGNVEAAATAESLRSQMLWLRGDGDDALDAGAAAASLVADRPPSPAKAWVLALEARREVVVRADNDSGRTLAAEALAMAEGVGRQDLAAHALNTIGMARGNSGDPAGLEVLERSIEVALEANSAVDVVFGINNLVNYLWVFGRLEEAAAQRTRHREAAERFGLKAGLVWNVAEAVYDPYLRGEYREMIKLAERFIADYGQEAHRQLMSQRLMAAYGYAAIGQTPAALARLEEALPEVRSAASAELHAFALLDRAFVLTHAGRGVEAGEPLAELLGDPHLLVYFHWLAPLPLLLVELGRERDFLEAIEPLPGVTPWREAAVAAAEGRLIDAAEIYERIGSRFVEAWARLLAAERGHRSQVEQASAFFGSIGAIPYLRRCEPLLSASA